MKAYFLSLLLLLVVALCFATTLEPWHQSWEGSRTTSANLMEVALGDGRQLFASHFFLKADAYFHNGFQRSIFDHQEGEGAAHLAESMHEDEDHEDEEKEALGKPLDWIDRFGRNFFPARHTHLGEAGCGHSCCQRARAEGKAKHDCEHQHAHEHEQESVDAADEREILPWLKLSLELDPKRVQTYTVGAFWLRTALKQVDEAERLLRDGLRQVPGDPEMLYELGRIHFEERKNSERARNLWELALQKVTERNAGQEKPETFLTAQILGNLATLEEKAGRKEAALVYLERLVTISPNKEAITKWIDSLRAR